MTHRRRRRRILSNALTLGLVAAGVVAMPAAAQARPLLRVHLAQVAAAWGDNEYGNLGDGTFVQRPVAAQTCRHRGCRIRCRPTPQPPGPGGRAGAAWPEPLRALPPRLQRPAPASVRSTGCAVGAGDVSWSFPSPERIVAGEGRAIKGLPKSGVLPHICRAAPPYWDASRPANGSLTAAAVVGLAALHGVGYYPGRGVPGCSGQSPARRRGHDRAADPARAGHRFVDAGPSPSGPG